MIEPTKEEQEIIKQFLQDKYNEKMPILHQYVNLVLFGNKSHNLIGKSTEQNIWTRHIIDSLQLLPYIKNAENIVDLGSGAGFPALVMAICNNSHMLLIEKSPVKSQFLKNVVVKLQLNANVCNEVLTRQNCINLIQKRSVVISRAFKNIDEIFSLVDKNKNVYEMVLLKGQKWKDEIKNVPSFLRNNWKYEVKNSLFNNGVLLRFTYRPF